MALRAALTAGRRLPAAGMVRASPLLAPAMRGALAPAALRVSAMQESQREMSARPTLSKPNMGTLAVDPLGENSTVQGVEYVLTGLDRLVNWARKSSMWPMTFGLA